MASQSNADEIGPGISKALKFKEHGADQASEKPALLRMTSIGQDNERAIARSKTLPRSFQAFEYSNSELDAIDYNTNLLTQMQRWILGLIIVDFDLDIGPSVHGTFPASLLCQSESENVAFSSFPDSLRADEGSQMHSFRIRETNNEEISARQRVRPVSKDGFVYGYSYFSRTRDTTLKRGYKQRSLVVLTHHQYPAFFSAISAIMGPLYQQHGVKMLEAACHNISNWPDPTTGATLELGFLGSVLSVEIPSTVDAQQLTDTSSFGRVYDPKLHILASSAPLMPPPLTLFEASLSHLWSIWECMLLCEPVLVFGSSAAMTSQAIWWFRDLLRPIPLANDFRPYFTIHDKDYSLIINKLPPKAGIMLGVTNPMFERLCKHWPHVLTLGRRTSEQISRKALSAAGPIPGWKTKTHKRYISKDQSLLKQLESACRSGGRDRIEASLALRRHFCSRTMAFLVPLNRYLNTLIPSPSELSSPNARRLKPFNSSDFLSSLKTYGSSLPFRSTSAERECYERWLRAPAFGLWLAQQEEVVQGVLGREHSNTNSI